jgi:sugar lactone lactonase YvrE
VWLAADRKLMWVDGTGCRIEWLDPSTGIVDVLDVGRTIGAAAPALNGRFIGTLNHDFALIDPAGSITVLSTVEANLPDNRLNDGKCDSRGRFWAGSCAAGIAPSSGALYRLNTDLSLDVMVRPVNLSNGIGWSPDDRRMYYIDSTAYRVDMFDYDAEGGDISNRRTLVEIDKTAGMPDGLTVDADGCVWVGLWGGWAVHRYDSSGRLDAVVRLPAENVTSCTFGGSDLRDLYITTAREDLDSAALDRQPEAGSLFVCRPGPAGLPPCVFGGG